MRTNPGPPMPLANMREEGQPILSNANDAEAEKAGERFESFVNSSTLGTANRPDGRAKSTAAGIRYSMCRCRGGARCL
jgi:hypothetical protein